jgi:hypothetical protein
LTACLTSTGCSVATANACLYAFDLLWLEAQDPRGLPSFGSASVPGLSTWSLAGKCVPDFYRRWVAPYFPLLQHSRSALLDGTERPLGWAHN